MNALFTTASAFSDTGLVVYDTFSHWNMFGQAIIAILILVGGLGIFALKFFIINYLFKKPIKSLNELEMIKNERGYDDVNNVYKVIKSSIKFILITILISSIAMSFYFFFTQPAHTFGISEILKDNASDKSAIFINPKGNWELSFRFGFFHTISAINNAGFDIISGNSLLPYYQNYTLQIWFIILLIIGGIGYPVIYDFKKYFSYKFFKKREKYYFSIFTKVSMITYSLVFLLGFIIIISFETASQSADTLWNKVYIPKYHYNDYINWISELGKYKSTNKEIYNELISLVHKTNKDDLHFEISKTLFDKITFLPNEDSRSLQFYLQQGYVYGSNFDKILATIFTSLSTRSAGFAVADIRDFTRGSIIVLIIMMFIGAAPASTGGGIRTTTFALILMSTFSVLTGRKKVRLFKRSIEEKTVQMSVQVLIITFILILVSVLICMTSLETYGGTIHTDDITLNKSRDLSSTFFDSEHIWFEVTSAFGTTGLSTGVTKQLNAVSKIVLIVVMFVGQFGVSSTLLVWRKKKSNERNYEYVTTDIVIG
ncbi:potassium transporter TrkG [Mycoplasma leonicaptivi]|uniref:potassium transporter TrkG n=1 Tax=Mycoplasma leonicaptivi TaxID=36742 RepID=UPI001FDED656|nr:potassium transporter TrkG [Mycoplasma leonicaptivi]